MYINYKMLKIQQFCLSIVVITKKFLNKLTFSLFQRNVIGISAKNIFELALELIDIVIMLSSKIEFDFFILCY